MAGLSLRAIIERYGLIKASREDVRLWVHRLEALAHSASPRPRRLVAIDEAKLRWVALSMGGSECGFEGGVGRLCLLAALKPRRLHIPPEGLKGLFEQALILVDGGP